MVPALGATAVYLSNPYPVMRSGLTEAQELFYSATSSAHILRGLYMLSKSRQKKVSLTFICRRAGIPSKGYLAFVMSGKRRLNIKYWGAICQTFKLEGIEENILKTLLLIEASPSDDTRATLSVQLARLKELLLELEQ